jgi:hypothetical protein
MHVYIETTPSGNQKVVISSENTNESSLLRVLMGKSCAGGSGTVIDGNSQSAELWLEMK